MGVGGHVDDDVVVHDEAEAGRDAEPEVQVAGVLPDLVEGDAGLAEGDAGLAEADEGQGVAEVLVGPVAAADGDGASSLFSLYSTLVVFIYLTCVLYNLKLGGKLHWCMYVYI